MRSVPPTTDLIVEAAPTPVGTRSATRSRLVPAQVADVAFELEPLGGTAVPRTRAGSRAAPAPAAPRYLARGKTATDLNPWDLAHAYRAEHGTAVGFVEPDVWQRYEFQTGRPPAGLRTRSFGPDACDDGSPYSGCWPHPADARIWHLGADFSQLAQARHFAEAQAPLPDGRRVRIAQLDTGYTPGHASRPAFIDTTHQRDFVDGGTQAVDPGTDGKLLNPGHGTATLALLAGQRLALPAYGGFDEELGGAPFAEVLPLRISPSVILWRTSAFVQALEHLLALPAAAQVQVLTMSMGGLASRAWADVVNRAYDAGIFLVTAAGNNMGNKTPRHVVYPARFGRVVAACGACYDYSPYNRRHNGWEMQGNYGPLPLMHYALTAYTPNTPWARMANATQVDLDGAGTSSATPQVAAAAACYWRTHWAALQALPEPWMRVEAIRRALFNSAGRSPRVPNAEEHELYFGHGLLQARAALDVPVPTPDQLHRVPPDSTHFPLFEVIFRAQPGTRGFVLPDNVEEQMLEQEMLQLTQQHQELEALLGDYALRPSQLPRPARRAFVDALLAQPDISQALRSYLISRYPEL